MPDSDRRAASRLHLCVGVVAYGEVAFRETQKKRRHFTSARAKCTRWPIALVLRRWALAPSLRFPPRHAASTALDYPAAENQYLVVSYNSRARRSISPRSAQASWNRLFSACLLHRDRGVYQDVNRVSRFGSQIKSPSHGLTTHTTVILYCSDLLSSRGAEERLHTRLAGPTARFA